MIDKIAVVLIFFLCFLYWLIQFILIFRVIHSVKVLEKISPAPLESWPRVSVILPARNEIKTMADAMESRLGDDYPNCEFILVDDRSDDGTGELVDDFSKKDKRIIPLHIRKLPPGWLGKIHALDQGAKMATGEWLLFSDVDVHITPGTMKKAIAHAKEQKLDHLAIFPDILSVNILLDILITIFIRLLCLAGKIWKVGDPKSTAAIGSGSFNLVRKSVLEKSKGFEWIRLEQGDDVALGKVLKESGARQSVLNGRRKVKVTIYRSIAEMAVAVERPTYAALGNFSFWRLFFSGWLMLFLELSPFLALLVFQIPHIQYLGIVMILLCVGLALATNIWFRRPVWTSIFTPVASIFMVLLMWRAGLMGARRKGVYWRGTFYPNDVLKKGRRFTWS